MMDTARKEKVARYLRRQWLAACNTVRNTPRRSFEHNVAIGERRGYRAAIDCMREIDYEFERIFEALDVPGVQKVYDKDNPSETNI